MTEVLQAVVPAASSSKLAGRADESNGQADSIVHPGGANQRHKDGERGSAVAGAGADR